MAGADQQADALLASCGAIGTGRSVRILFLGEKGVGKSSLMWAILSGEEAQPPPGELDPHELRGDFGKFFFSPSLRNVLQKNNIVLLDTDADAYVGRSLDGLVSELRRLDPHVVVLCFDATRPETLHRLHSHWLKGVEAAFPPCYSGDVTAAGGGGRGGVVSGSPSSDIRQPYVPVVLCPLKAEAGEGSSDDVAAWRTAYRTVLASLSVDALEGTGDPCAEGALSGLGGDGEAGSGSEGADNDDDDSESVQEEVAAMVGGPAGAGEEEAEEEGGEGEVAGAEGEEAGATTAAAAAAAPRTPAPSRRRGRVAGAAPGDPTDAPDAAARALALADVYERRTLTALVAAHPCILGTHFMSLRAPGHPLGLQGAVSDLLCDVVGFVAHPVFPLADMGALADAGGSGGVDESCLAPAFSRALHRIFALHDRDQDGLWSCDELCNFLFLVEGAVTTEPEVQGVLLRLHEEHLAALEAEEGASTAGVSSRPAWVLVDTAGPVPRLYLTLWGLHRYAWQRITASRRDFVWFTLFKFGYRLGYHDGAGHGYPEGSVPEDAAFGLYLPEPTAHAGLVAALGDAFALQLGGTAAAAGTSTTSLYPRDGRASLSLDAFASPAALRAAALDGLHFLAARFRLASHNGATLTTGEVDALFRETASGAHPFGAGYPFVCQHAHYAPGDASSGGVSFDTWIALWQMALAVNPRGAMQCLYELGWRVYDGGDLRVAPPAGSAASAGHHPWGVPARSLQAWAPALILQLVTDVAAGGLEAVPRRPSPATFAAAGEALGAAAAGPSASAAAGVAGVCGPLSRRLAVLGSAGAGKTSLIQALVNEPAGLDEFRRAGGSASLLAQGEPFHAVTAAAVDAAALEAAAAALLASAGLPAAASPAAAAAAAAALLPRHLVLTEWPSHHLPEAMEAIEAGGADAALVVVDPASPSSVLYLRQVAEALPEGVPLLVVAAPAEDPAAAAAAAAAAKAGAVARKLALTSEEGAPRSAPGSRRGSAKLDVALDAGAAAAPAPAAIEAARGVGLSLLAALCSADGTAPDGATLPELWRQLLACAPVASDADAARAVLADPAKAELLDMASPGPGLDVPLFTLPPWADAGAELSELCKYTTIRSVDTSADCPRTATRRAAAAAATRRRRLVTAAKAVGGLTALAVVGWLAYKHGDKVKEVGRRVADKARARSAARAAAAK